MAKLKKLEDVRIIDLVKRLIKEKITKSWLKDILLGNRFKASHFFRDSSEAEFFDICIWDNLTPEQQKKVIEELNVLIEEDLYKPFRDCSYLQELVTLACILGEKNPGSINAKPLIDWMNKGFRNLAPAKNYETSLHAEFKRKIEKAFSKKNS